jgi:hypothetical protein
MFGRLEFLELHQKAFFANICVQGKKHLATMGSLGRHVRVRKRRQAEIDEGVFK